MFKRKIEKLDIETSLLGFGCMRLPEKNGGVDMEQTRRMIELAYENGVNYFDTAYVYHGGRSEVAMGGALKKYPRESFFAADKMPLWNVRSQGDLERIFNEQLKRLGMEYIDFYLLHALDKALWEKVVRLDIISFLEKKRAQGRLRRIGFSFHDTPDVFERIISGYDWDFCQIQLNYVDWLGQRACDLYRMAEEKGIPLIVMEPVRGGGLANPAAEIKDIFEEAAPGRSAASWALRYAGSLPQVKVVLSGMSTIGQVEDNLSTFGAFSPLSPDEYRVIDRVTEVMSGVKAIPCTGCRYCMPCPSGVDIPENFSMYNDFYKYNNPNALKWRFSQLGEGAAASGCVECGACLAKCPQHIDIPDQLKKAGDFEATLK